MIIKFSSRTIIFHSPNYFFRTESQLSKGKPENFELYIKAQLINNQTQILPIKTAKLQKVDIFSKFFRFPYWWENAFIKIVHSGPIVGWNVDAYDWKAKDPKKLAQKIIEQSKDGSIILLHDIKSDTVSALPIIIDGLRSKDFTIVPLHILLSWKIKPQWWIIYKSRYNSSYTKKIPMKDAIKTFSRKNVTLPQKQPSIITTISTW